MDTFWLILYICFLLLLLLLHCVLVPFRKVIFFHNYFIVIIKNIRMLFFVVSIWLLLSPCTKFGILWWQLYVYRRRRQDKSDLAKGEGERGGSARKKAVCIDKNVIPNLLVFFNFHFYANDMNLVVVIVPVVLVYLYIFMWRIWQSQKKQQQSLIHI